MLDESLVIESPPSLPSPSTKLANHVSATRYIMVLCIVQCSLLASDGLPPSNYSTLNERIATGHSPERILSDETNATFNGADYREAPPSGRGFGKGMQVPKKQCKRRRLSCGGSENSCVRHRPLRRNHVWSYDFIEDRTEKNRKLRMLVVTDEFTRESLAIEMAWSFKSQQVIDVLQYLFAVRGAPEHLRSDNGPEFVAKAVTRWLDRAGVKTLFIANASPWENGYVESFNSRFRDELLDRELFVGLEDARWVVDRWRLDYNHQRPHRSLGYQTSAAFAARCSSSVRPPVSL